MHPDSNIEGSSLVIRKPDFGPVNTVVLLKAIQELRGLFTHYSNCSRKWRIFARPIDVLSAYSDVCSMWIRCGDSEYRIAFWNLIAFLRMVSLGEQTWGNLFTGALLDLLTAGIRFAGPIVTGKATWSSGDATLTRVSCVNWGAEEFIFLPVGDLMGPFMPRHRQGFSSRTSSFYLSFCL